MDTKKKGDLKNMNEEDIITIRLAKSAAKQEIKKILHLCMPICESEEQAKPLAQKAFCEIKEFVDQ